MCSFVLLVNMQDIIRSIKVNNILSSTRLLKIIGSISAVSRVRSLILVRAHFPEQRLVIEPTDKSQRKCFFFLKMTTTKFVETSV